MREQNLAWLCVAPNHRRLLHGRPRRPLYTPNYPCFIALGVFLLFWVSSSQHRYISPQKVTWTAEQQMRGWLKGQLFIVPATHKILIYARKEQLVFTTIFFLFVPTVPEELFFLSLYLHVSPHGSNVTLIWNGSNVNIQIELTSDCFAYERFTHSLHHAGWRVQHRHSLDSLYFAFCRCSRTCLVCRVPGGFLFKRLSFRPRLEESSLILLMYDNLILAILTWFL